MTIAATPTRVDLGRVLGIELPGLEYTVERGAVRQFAEAIGERGAVHHDLAAARAAGHPDLLVPPTFLFGAARERPFPLGFLAETGIDGSRLLHGEQTFAYHRPVHAGDVLRVLQQVTDAFRKGPAMTFIRLRTDLLRRPDDEPVVTLDSLIIVREDPA